MGRSEGLSTAIIISVERVRVYEQNTRREDVDGNEGNSERNGAKAGRRNVCLDA